MMVKGFDKFRAKLPALSGKKFAVLPIYTVLMLAAAFAVQLMLEKLPETLMSSGASLVLLSLFPIFSSILVVGVGFLLAWQMWFQRARMKAKYGPSAYQRMFLIGFGGIMWILSASVNQYLPFYAQAPGFWAVSPLQFIATPLEAYMGTAAPAFIVLKHVLTAALLTIGFMTFVRAITTFGMDYMAVVYLYFPEESEIQKNEIYSALRHPAYSGALVVALGGMLLYLTITSIAVFAALLSFFYIHIRFVEERELIQRFGDSYRAYLKDVPAFFVHPRKAGVLLRFLFKPNPGHQ